MAKHSSRINHQSTALSALGIAGVSLALVSGASASTGEATANVPSILQSHEIFLGEEEISDVSLATFYVFDKENTGPPPLTQQLRLARSGRNYGRDYGCGRDGGCGGCAGCGGGGANTNGGCGGGVDNYP